MEGNSGKKTPGKATPKKQSTRSKKLKKAIEKDPDSIDVKKAPKKTGEDILRKTSYTPNVNRLLAFDSQFEPNHPMKYIFVCGGTMSGLGKGVTVSSIGAILQSYGFSITAIKIDPYLNLDAGTMSPFEHGEVYVLEDGAEADLDLGNYERYLDVHLTGNHNLTTGKVYNKVIEAERQGDYLGKTVQVVPHITNAIVDWISGTSEIGVDNVDRNKLADICLVEVGGTVGDLESGAYYEALRQFILKKGTQNCALGFVSYVPCLSGDELKTKPTQHGVKELRSLGLSPDFIVCRCEIEVSDDHKGKIAEFTNVKESCVFSAHNVEDILFVPNLLEKQGAGFQLMQKFNLEPKTERSTKWDELTSTISEINIANNVVNIAIVGKYTGLQDSYLSVIKALEHAAIGCERKLKITWIESKLLEEAKNDAWDQIKACDGILVPGGFGERGAEGKIKAIQYAREHKKPYFGICLGMQLAIIEFCRNVLGLKDADSEEFDESSEDKVIIFMPEISKVSKGGTMRLGARHTIINDSESLACKIYGGASS